jgi:subtilisin family serine protease
VTKMRLKGLVVLGCSLFVTSGQTKELLVKMKAGVHSEQNYSIQNFITSRGGEVIQEYEIVPGLVRVQVRDEEAQDLLNGLQLFSNVEYAIPNMKRTPALFGVSQNGPLASAARVEARDPAIPPVPAPLREWKKDPTDYLNYPTAAHYNGTRKVWEKYGAIGDSKTVIAVLDTGVDYTHPDLLGNMWRNLGESGVDSSGQSKETNGIDDDGNGFVDDVVGYDFSNKDALPYDDHSHGTHVAGLAAAVGGNGYGSAGQCPRCSIMALKFITAEGSGTDADAISGLEYAMKMKATVINSSWGGSEFNQALLDAFKATSAAGIVNVVAAGNAGTDLDRSTPDAYPAEFRVPGLYTVSALYEVNINITWWSNYGKKASHLSQGGADITSTVPGASYATMSGTSMASPGVAGCLGLILSYKPTLKFADLDRLMDKNTIGDPRSMSMVKYRGRLDMQKIFKTLSVQ